MDQQLIKDTIKVLKDFGTFWTELPKFFKGSTDALSTFVGWNTDRETKTETTGIWANTKSVFGSSSK